MYREIQCGDTMFNNIYEMANIFNGKYFVNSISMKVEEEYVTELMMEKYTENQFELFSVINVRGLNRIVYRLENKNGTEEGITVEIIKKVVSVAGPKICYIMNRSLEEGIFPSEWKEAIVIPIQGTENEKN